MCYMDLASIFVWCRDLSDRRTTTKVVNKTCGVLSELSRSVDWLRVSISSLVVIHLKSIGSL